MRCSSGMKAAIIKRILPPNEELVTDVSRETAVSTTTIYYWKNQAAEGMLCIGDDDVRPRDRSLTEIAGEHGVHPAQVHRWKRN